MTQQIGKLAVVVTSDTSQLDAGFNRAQGTVQRFAVTANKAGAATQFTLAKGAQTASNAISGMRGNVLPLVSTLSSSGGMVAGVGAAALGLAAFTRAAINAADAAQQARKAMGWNEARIGDQYERAGKAAKNLLATVAEITGLSQAAWSFWLSAADAIESATAALKTDAMKERDAIISHNEKVRALKQKIAEEQVAADKAAGEAMRKQIDALRNSAQSITQSLRTPGEVFADTAEELHKMFGLGLLDIETMNRALAKAQGDLQSAAKDAAKVKQMFQAASYQPIGAVERFTSSGASAAMAGKAELMKAVELQKQQLAEEKVQTRIMDEGFKALKNKPPITFKEGRF
jgi:hypothetical protein